MLRHANKLHRSALLGLAAVLTGCGGTEPTSLLEASPCAPACITLGTGVEAFEPLQDGDDIEITAGIQGGFHLIASVRVRGLEPGRPNEVSPDNPVLDFTVYADDTEIDASTPLAVGLSPFAPGRFERLGRRVVLDNEAVEPFEGFDGTSLRLAVRIEDAWGLSSTAQVELTARTVP